jgi:hydroxypyruvate isomerase
MESPFRYAVNCSLLFREVPLLERPAAAAAAGFDAVEFWWPWPDQPAPGDRDVDAFVGSVEDAGVSLIGLNFFAGDLFGPDCGVLSVPERVGEFRDNVDVAVGIGERLGVRAFNALYGNRVEDAGPQEQDQLAVESLVAAARAAGRIGATVLVEPVSGPKPYPLRTADDVAAVLDRVRGAGVENVAMLCDLFHLANNGDDVAAAIDKHAKSIAHVQVADHPGRGEPGTGALDLSGHLARLLSGHLARLEAAGYDGWVALEYNPTTTTTESLAWLPRDRRGAGAAQQRQGD